MASMYLSSDLDAVALFEQSPISTSVFTPDGTAVAANAAWEQFWNASAEQAVGRYNVLHDTTVLPPIRTVLEAAFKGQVAGTPAFLYDPAANGFAGDARWLRFSCFPLFDTARQLKHVVMQQFDVTDMKLLEVRLEERVAEQTAELRQRLDEIQAQRSIIEALATPILQVNDATLVMPLVGAIDSQRAQLVMNALLTGVAMHRATTVIVDITGVPVVDTQVAMVIVQAAQAVKLLGAQVILTGIRPEIAQTLVGLGADLGRIQTVGTLEDGIRLANH